MKFLLAVIAMFYLASANDTQNVTIEEFTKNHKECFNRVPEANEYLESLKNFVYPDAPAVRKFIRCEVDAMGIKDTKEPGHFDEESLIALLKIDQNNIKDVNAIKKCAHQDDGLDDTEKLAKQVKCLEESHLTDKFYDELRKYSKTGKV